MKGRIKAMVWKFGSKISGTQTYAHSRIVELANDSPVAIFAEELLSVCRKHGFSLVDHDVHGGIDIYRYDAKWDEVIQDAHACLEPDD